MRTESPVFQVFFPSEINEEDYRTCCGITLCPAVDSEPRKKPAILSSDVAPIDHTERRHDVTFISVDVESQENLCKIFYRILANEIIVYMRILWNFHRKNG
jgi:hypothetical protein